MDTTTSDGGATAQPTQTSEAVTAGHNADQVITTDSNGTPSLEPATSQAQGASEEAVTETVQAPVAETATETQATDDIADFAKAKGFDPTALTEGERKALDMARNAEKRMHEATQKSRELEVTATQVSPIEYTGDPVRDQQAEILNQLVIKNAVNDFFATTPEAREFESKMAEIVQTRPHLSGDLDALYALARNDPGRETELRAEGGKQALTNLAQKQSQIPPTAGATNSGSYQSQTITPQNVSDLVDSNDQAWFEKNHEAISRAMSGK